MGSILLWCGAVGAVLFVLVFTVDGLTRPGYRPTYHPVSALSLGERGRIQVANFIGSGFLITLGGIGIGLSAAPAVKGVIAAILIAVFGLALVASGWWTMDPMREYPPGTSAGTPKDTSRAHELHDHAGAVVFGSLPAAGFMLTWWFGESSMAGWAIYSGLVSAGLVAGFLKFGAAWEEDHRHTGLIQRLMIIPGWLWLGTVFVRLALA